LRTLIGGRVLPCSCLAGTYQSWNNQVVVILDERSVGCEDQRHQPNMILWASRDAAVAVDRDEVYPAEPA
jgi:hypothetical protein